MFFSFVSFITNRNFFLTCLENTVYHDVYEDIKDEVGIFFKSSNFEGWGSRAKDRGKLRPVFMSFIVLSYYFS